MQTILKFLLREVVLPWSSTNMCFNSGCNVVQKSGNHHFIMIFAVLVQKESDVRERRTSQRNDQNLLSHVGRTIHNFTITFALSTEAQKG